MHPSYYVNDLSPLVEEGCAQLIKVLFLREGIPFASDETYVDGGPSEEKLRQSLRYRIEIDYNEIYGGYRQAATAYSAIGIEKLMSHVVLSRISLRFNLNSSYGMNNYFHFIMCHAYDCR